MKKLLLVACSGIIVTINSLIAQCTFSGLNPTYCSNEAPSTLIPPGSGVFSGPGVVGNTFDPAVAGPGTHQIDYAQADPSIYTIDQSGTYSPIAGTGTAVSLGDDQVSAILPIGFTFNFFGNNYTDFYISSNGFITFANDLNSGCCSGQVLPNVATPNNLIAFSWDDMYPPGNGSIQYFISGSSPSQKLVINFYDIPFCCGTTPQVKTQLILNETSNIIEIHTEYAVGVNPGTMGIENLDGTVAYTVTGRNSEVWPNLANDYVAFLPDICLTSQSVTVFPAPVVSGTVDINPACVGDSVIFTGAGADTYSWDNGVMDGSLYEVSASGVYNVIGTENTNGCFSSSTVTHVVNPNPTISLSANDELFGNDGGINLTINSGIAPFTFDWSNDGMGDNNDNNDLNGVAEGTYTVVMTDGNGCMVTDSATVLSQLGLINLSGVEFSIQPNPSNGIFKIILQESNFSTDLYLEIVNNLGQKIITDKIKTQIVNVNISENEAGIYFVKIVSEKGSSVKRIVLK